MPTFELRCRAHGEIENSAKRCPHGCPADWVTQEIRTPPAYRRSGKMRFVDQQLKGIAQDAGLSDLKNDPKAGLSVLDCVKKTPEQQRPRWGEVPHAAPGFSRDPKAEVPKISGQNFGTQPSSASKFYETPPPPPRPQFVGRPRD